MAILEPIYTHDRARLAACAGTAMITYGRLCDDIDSMAHFLLGNCGLAPGDRVTLHLFNSGVTDYWEWIMHLGAIRAGLVHSTGGMPPAIARTGAIGPYKAAIGAIGKLQKGANPALRIRFAPQSSAPLAEQVDIQPYQGSLDGLERQAVRLLSTSGTTGQPKVIKWSAELFDARLKQVRDTGDIAPDSMVLTLLGLITTTGLRYPIATWQVGGVALLAGIAGEGSNMAEFAAASTFFATSPFRMQTFRRRVPGEWPGKDKRLIELFGGRVPPLVRDDLLARCCSTLRMSYGATEVGRVAAGDTSLVDRHPGAVGKVEPGITVEIVDANGTPKPAGEQGIVRMKSGFMADGYVGQPTRTGPRAPFRDGWFYPGDLGVLYDDGVFAIAGRNADTINMSGAKLSAVAIEERVNALPEVEDVCAVALQLDATDMLAIAVVCAKGVDLPGLRKKIMPFVPTKFPFTLVQLSKIPRNAMGRVSRVALAKRLTANAKERLAAASAKPKA